MPWTLNAWCVLLHALDAERLVRRDCDDRACYMLDVPCDSYIHPVRIVVHNASWRVRAHQAT